MNDQSGKELGIRIPRELPPHQDMDLQTARIMLEEVVSISEFNLKESDNFSKIGRYSIEEVRKGIVVMVTDLQNNSNVTSEDRRSIISKDTPLGKAKLGIYRHWDTSGLGEPESIRLSIEDPQNSHDALMECEVPVADIDHTFIASTQLYRDNRSSKKINVSSGKLEKAFKMSDYARYWRGFRWLTANVLNWNKGLILPEDLDTKFIPNHPKTSLIEAKPPQLQKS